MNVHSSKPGAEMAGFAAAVLDDPEIEEIGINEPGRVFVARRRRSELTTLIVTGDEVADLVERTLRSSGRRIDFTYLLSYRMCQRVPNGPGSTSASPLTGKDAS